MEQNKISRRNFLRVAGASATAAAMSGLVPAASAAGIKGKLQMINRLERSNLIQNTFFRAEITEKERITIMPLTLMDVGVETTVKTIRGKDQTRKFLQNLGFVEGAKVTVVSSLAGNVIVNVKDARVAISEQMASRIMV